MTAPLRFLLLVIGGWLALRLWAVGEPSLDRLTPSPPARLAAAPPPAAAAPRAAPPTTPLEAAAAAAAAAQAAATAARAADAAAVAAQAASIAAEAAAAAAGIPVRARPALVAVGLGERQAGLAQPNRRWRQAAAHRAGARRYFQGQERAWRERAAPSSAPLAASIADGDWSLSHHGTPASAADGAGRDEQLPVRLASSGLPQARSVDQQPPAERSAISPASAARDRLRLTSWLLWRPSVGTSSLASGATLGDSQAGARLAFDLRPSVAASLRAYAPLRGAKGGEVAAGVTWTPLPKLPVRVTAERRQKIGSGGGRSAFALFAEGGFYHRPLPLDFRLDGYAQGGSSDLPAAICSSTAP